MKIAEFLDAIDKLIEEGWSHLRHSLRYNLEIDDKLREDIIKILNKK